MKKFCFSDSGISGTYGLDKFLVKAHSQHIREVNEGTGTKSKIEIDPQACLLFLQTATITEQVCASCFYTLLPIYFSVVQSEFNALVRS